MADDPWSPSERYERTYSRNLDDALQALKAASTTNDYAIACALSELSRVQEDEAAAQAPRPDTSYDEQLALSLHEREANKLLRALRSLLRHLQPTQVVPRLNPTVEPSAAWVSEDRQRLLLRLDMYGLQERPVKGDGNCQVGGGGWACTGGRMHAWQHRQWRTADSASSVTCVRCLPNTRC
jgi:hypothetical protein